MSKLRDRVAFKASGPRFSHLRKINNFLWSLRVLHWFVEIPLILWEFLFFIGGEKPEIGIRLLLVKENNSNAVHLVHHYSKPDRKPIPDPTHHPNTYHKSIHPLLGQFHNRIISLQFPYLTEKSEWQGSGAVWVKSHQRFSFSGYFMSGAVFLKKMTALGFNGKPFSS